MSYCLNPTCPNPVDPLNANNRFCIHCGSDLLLMGRYRAIQQLGTNCFDKTFEVEHHGTKKVLKVLQLNDPMAISRFQQHAKVLNQLNHPGIPRVEPEDYFSFLPNRGQAPAYCLLMEKIEGQNLQQWLSHRRHQAIAQEQALDWLHQLTEILDRVHRLPYFHLDIKPSNIILRPSGELVLIDFGAAREITCTYLMKMRGWQTVSGINSPGYTPTEQLNSQAIPSSDFFALGRTFVHLLTGKHPLGFYHAYNDEILWRSSAPHVSPAIADLIDRLMAPNPNQRPQNTSAILQELAAIEQSFHTNRKLSPSPENSNATGDREAHTPTLQPYQTAQLISLPSARTTAAEFQGVSVQPVPTNTLALRRKNYRKAAMIGGAIATLGIFMALGLGISIVLSGESKVSQCNRLIQAIGKGNEELNNIEGNDAATARHLATHLDVVVKELEGVELADDTLQGFPKRLIHIYQDLGRAFHKTGEAINTVEAAPSTPAGLQQVKEATNKAEAYGKEAKQSAERADSLAGELKNYCSGK